MERDQVEERKVIILVTRQPCVLTLLEGYRERIPATRAEVSEHSQAEEQLEDPEEGHQRAGDEHVHQLVGLEGHLEDPQQAQQAQRLQHADRPEGLPEARKVDHVRCGGVEQEQSDVQDNDENVDGEPRLQVDGCDNARPQLDVPIGVLESDEEVHADVHGPKQRGHATRDLGPSLLSKPERHERKREEVVRDDQDGEHVPAHALRRPRIEDQPVDVAAHAPVGVVLVRADRPVAAVRGAAVVQRHDAVELDGLPRPLVPQRGKADLLAMQGFRRQLAGQIVLVGRRTCGGPVERHVRV
mmetsp:Transcript_83374/g.254888  ORF Transcript_83374/g.254888 Transcript_83374/m.254888 type:complete len:299 (+) Transcript_83374:978-1874(+)